MRTSIASRLRRARRAAFAAAALLLCGCGRGPPGTGSDAASGEAGAGVDGGPAGVLDAGGTVDAGPLPTATVDPLTLQGQAALVDWLTTGGSLQLRLDTGAAVEVVTYFILDNDTGQETLLGTVVGPGMVELTGVLESDGTFVSASGWIAVQGFGVTHESLLGVDPTSAVEVTTFVTSLVGAGAVEIDGFVDIGAGAIPLCGYEPLGDCTCNLPAFVGPEGTDLTPYTTYFEKMDCRDDGTGGCTCELRS